MELEFHKQLPAVCKTPFFTVHNIHIFFPPTSITLQLSQKTMLPWLGAKKLETAIQEIDLAILFNSCLK